jgi:hypothetical protein
MNEFERSSAIISPGNGKVKTRVGFKRYFDFGKITRNKKS